MPWGHHALRAWLRGAHARLPWCAGLAAVGSTLYSAGTATAGAASSLASGIWSWATEGIGGGAEAGAGARRGGGGASGADDDGGALPNELHGAQEMRPIGRDEATVRDRGADTHDGADRAWRDPGGESVVRGDVAAAAHSAGGGGEVRRRCARRSGVGDAAGGGDW